MAPTYSAIRRQHLVFALRSLTRRQQTALGLIVAILGPTSVGIMQGLASALDVFVRPEPPAGGVLRHGPPGSSRPGSSCWRCAKRSS
jgi:hypothetical protein